MSEFAGRLKIWHRRALWPTENLICLLYSLGAINENTWCSFESDEYIDRQAYLR